MTDPVRDAFEAWYRTEVGISVSEALRRGVIDVEMLLRCWQAAHASALPPGHWAASMRRELQRLVDNIDREAALNQRKASLDGFVEVSFCHAARRRIAALLAALSAAPAEPTCWIDPDTLKYMAKQRDGVLVTLTVNRYKENGDVPLYTGPTTKEPQQ